MTVRVGDGGQGGMELNRDALPAAGDGQLANTDRVPAGTFGDVDEHDEVGADVSFEVTGVQAPLRDVGDATRMAGTVVIVGAGFMGALVLKLVLLKGPRRVFVADTRAEDGNCRPNGPVKTFEPQLDAMVKAKA